MLQRLRACLSRDSGVVPGLAMLRDTEHVITGIELIGAISLI